MAGVHAHHRGAVRHELVDLGLQLLGQVLQLGSQAGLQALAGPDQLFAERGQLGAAALLAHDQGRLEEGGPLLDQVPAMAIGQVLPVRRAGDLTGGADLVQEVEHHQHRLGLAVPPEAPLGLDLDPDQRPALPEFRPRYMHFSAYQ